MPLPFQATPFNPAEIVALQGANLDPNEYVALEMPVQKIQLAQPAKMTENTTGEEAEGWITACIFFLPYNQSRFLLGANGQGQLDPKAVPISPLVRVLMRRSDLSAGAKEKVAKDTAMYASLLLRLPPLPDGPAPKPE
jgi:hypothetical protein